MIFEGANFEDVDAWIESSIASTATRNFDHPVEVGMELPQPAPIATPHRRKINVSGETGKLNRNRAATRFKPSRDQVGD